MANNIAAPLKWVGILMFAAFGTTAFAAPCDPDEHSWIPSRYYPPGQTVFHQGNWYESRELHEGKTPGAAFEWKKRASAPECHTREETGPVAKTTREDKSQPSEPPGREAEQSSKKASKTRSPSCDEPGRWSFGGSYTVGQMAVHEGQTYRAIRPSNGQMPGMSQPPHWQPVDDPCQD
ncbi:carbohydrate-binding protein [Marinobacter sp.]|uniref:carbohydrate-binding protein n=1 Tax=Marinobacter sp. TaxID=50741 RepID=UPI003BA98858